MSQIESEIFRMIDEGGKVTFEEIIDLKMGDGASREDIETALRDLLQKQKIAKTADWKYYATKE